MTAELDSLSIIVPLHNEQENIQQLRIELTEAIPQLDCRDVEILLIDDGSTDRTSELIHQLVDDDARFKVITLTRNFGHQAAVSIGLQHSRHAIIAVIDGDLQDPPSQLVQLVTAIRSGADVAYGVRQRRKEHILKRAAYASFYRVLRRVADIDIPVDSGDFCCMRRCVVDAMLQLPERNRFVRGLRAWVGFRQVGVPYERAARFAGTPAYTWSKLIQLAIDGMFSFTTLPIRVTQLLGFLISASALAIASFYLVLFFVRPDLFPRGFATITISIWLIAGLQLFFLGLLGEYIARTFDEVRRRPTALIAKIATHVQHDLDVVEAPETVAGTTRTANSQPAAGSFGGYESRMSELLEQFQTMLEQEVGTPADVPSDTHPQPRSESSADSNSRPSECTT